MDIIQNFLIKIGRKDLAQRYYLRVKKAQENSVEIDDLSDLFRGHVGIVKDILDGKMSVTTDKGSYVLDKSLRNDELRKDMIVAGYNDPITQGFDVFEILGITDIDKDFGRGGVKFNNVKDLLKHYGASNLKDLEIKQNKIVKDEYGRYSYLVVKNLESNRTKPMFYPVDGEWSMGEGAEAIFFRLMKKV